MAENKKYYWIKLKTDFFDLPSIDWLLSQKNGCEYIVLYQMLCLKTANSDGDLTTKIGEMLIPYDVEKIVRDTKYFSFDTVAVALDLYKKLGLIYESQENCLTIANYENMIGCETKWAEKKRQYRENQKLLRQDNGQKVDNVRQENRDKILDIRDKSIDIDIDKEIDINAPSDLENHSMPAIELTLNDKSLYPVYENMIDEWKELYPNVDVMQELRKMKGWLNANPKKRKTKSGILRFINSWLTREQDKGYTQPKKETFNITKFDI